MENEGKEVVGSNANFIRKTSNGPWFSWGVFFLMNDAYCYKSLHPEIKNYFKR